MAFLTAVLKSNAGSGFALRQKEMPAIFDVLNSRNIS